MDLKFYRLTEDEGNRHATPGNLVPKDRQPSEDTAVLKCEVELTPGVKLFGWAWGDNVFISDGSQMLWHHPLRAEEAKPFFEAEVQGSAYHRTKRVEVKSRRSIGWHHHGQGDVAGPIIEVPEDYDHYYDYGVDRYQSTGTYVRGTPWSFLDVKVTCKDVSEVMTFRFKRPDAGVAVVPESGQEIACHNDFFGLRLEWTEMVINIDRGVGGAHYHCTNSGLHTLWRLLTRYRVSDKQALWARFLEGIVASGGLQKIDDKGVKGVENRKGIKENLARLEAEEPVLWRFWLWLHNGKVRNGMNNNSLLAAFLKEHGKDYDALVTGLRQAMDVGPDSDIKEPPSYYYERDDDDPLTLRPWCTRLPGAGEERRERLAKKDWTLRKGLANQAEGLGVTKERFPKLFEAIESKQIPLSVFHQPSNKDQPVNIEFDLWEKALKQPGWAEPLFEIAQDAGRRSTYEKDITPYIAFLFHLPKYLDRHTEGRKKWRALPKYVSSEWELEMDDEAQGGTTKRRSALTPVADNEERIITVPYAAMAIHGISTTYCYSLRYHVLEENMIDPESGTPVVNELERKLNGRDDYGLMFYTLTGTARNRGYPAFLIIFERLKAGTRVHFHRVHPCRSKNGVVTPASRLIQECYRYMAGNIRAEEIHAQQGDLIFIRNETQQLDWANEGQPVAEFESHAFVPTNGKPILLIENTAKSIKNRLGFLHCDEAFLVDHPEHEPLDDMPAGTYEVRRCKSWEANPKAVWTLTID